MPYKVYTRLSEEGEWNVVIDMKLSRLKKVDRIFMNENQAQFFAKNLPHEEQNVKIEEVDLDE